MSEEIQWSPDSMLEVTIKLGTLYLQMQQEEAAAEFFNKALELNDNIVDSYIGLVIAQKASGNLPDARKTRCSSGLQPPIPVFLSCVILGTALPSGPLRVPAR